MKILDLQVFSIILCMFIILVSAVDIVYVSNGYFHIVGFVSVLGACFILLATVASVKKIKQNEK